MAKRRVPTRRPDPYRDLLVGQVVLLSSALVDPVHWWTGTVLWIGDDRQEVLVRQNGIAGRNPHNQLHSLDYVRGFGTLQDCVRIKTEAERVVRQAARQAAEIEDMAAEFRARLTELFETVAAGALKQCGAAVRSQVGDGDSGAQFCEEADDGR